MKVSVVIPCFNMADKTPTAVQSVVEQTYNDIEIICVNDGSKDATGAELERLAREYEGRCSITVIHQENQGAGAARNAGIARAGGAYLQFLDADDQLFPTKVEHQVEIATAVARKNVDVVVGALSVVGKQGQPVSVTFRPEDLWVSLFTSRLGRTSGNLWNAAALTEAGGWDPTLASSQEYDLLFRMLQRDASVVFDEVPLTRKYEHGESNWGKHVWDNRRRYIELRIGIKQYLEDSGKMDAHRRSPVTTHLLQHLRRYSLHDRAGARRFYATAFPRGVVVTDIDAPQLYRAVFRIGGFRAAEELVFLARRARRSLGVVKRGAGRFLPGGWS